MFQFTQNSRRYLLETNREDIFSKELSWIGDVGVREFTRKALALLPEYFFHVPASSSGKYHPAYALGEGGLVRHTKAAVAFAHDLIGTEIFKKLDSVQKDWVISALILHDGMKYGLVGGTHSVKEHPNIMADWIGGNPKLQGIIPDDQIQIIQRLIRSHMGQWNCDNHGREIMPKPIGLLEKIVHLCDYLASRKWVTVESVS
jgi:hypothetical protein